MRHLACIIFLLTTQTRAFHVRSSKVSYSRPSPWKKVHLPACGISTPPGVASLSNLHTLRGGSLSLDALPARLDAYAKTTPTNFFNAIFIALGGFIALFKLIDSQLISKSKSTSSLGDSSNDKKPEAMKSLQLRFLGVFWLLRMADWLQ